MKYVLESVFISNLLHLTRMKLLLLHLNGGSKRLFKKVCLFNHCTIRKFLLVRDIYCTEKISKKRVMHDQGKK